MTESEKLRAGLDKSGVKWWPMRNGGYCEDRDTEFVVGGKKHTAHEWGDGLAVYNLTAQQAIDAALGIGREEAYDAGFANGMKATLQQIDGLIQEGAGLDGLQRWIDAQWEGEGE